MLWKHVNLAERVWTIPSTKTETEHRVPLSDSAVKLLKEIKLYEAKKAKRNPSAPP